MKMFGRTSWANFWGFEWRSRQNGGLVMESPENVLNPGLGSVVICPGMLSFFQ